MRHLFGHQNSRKFAFPLYLHVNWGCALFRTVVSENFGCVTYLGMCTIRAVRHLFGGFTIPDGQCSDGPVAFDQGEV